MTLQGPDGEGRCTLTMLKEGEDWKVGGLNLDASMVRAGPKAGDAE